MTAYLILGYEVSAVEDNSNFMAEEYDYENMTISVVGSKNGPKFFGYILAEANEKYFDFCGVNEFLPNLGYYEVSIVEEAARQRYGYDDVEDFGEPSVYLALVKE